jgi:hypothetical protein
VCPSATATASSIWLIVIHQPMLGRNGASVCCSQAISSCTGCGILATAKRMHSDNGSVESLCKENHSPNFHTERCITRRRSRRERETVFLLMDGVSLLTLAFDTSMANSSNRRQSSQGPLRLRYLLRPHMGSYYGLRLAFPMVLSCLLRSNDCPSREPRHQSVS